MNAGRTFGFEASVDFLNELLSFLIVHCFTLPSISSFSIVLLFLDFTCSVNM